MASRRIWPYILLLYTVTRSVYEAAVTTMEKFQSGNVRDIKIWSLSTNCCIVMVYVNPSQNGWRDYYSLLHMHGWVSYIFVIVKFPA